MKTPEVRIYFSWLLYEGECQYLEDDGYKLESSEVYEKKTVAYQKAWAKYEKQILTALQECLGVSFHQPVIDVACAPMFIPKSQPLILNYAYEPDQFVDILTHELCHVLLCDNNKFNLHSNKPNMNLVKLWEGWFGKQHDFNTLVHIPVHALCKYIYLDVLKQPKRHSRDVKTSKNYARQGEHESAYTKAWDYVDKHDYQQIITNLKKSYREVTK